MVLWKSRRMNLRFSIPEAKRKRRNERIISSVFRFEGKEETSRTNEQLSTRRRSEKTKWNPVSLSSREMRG